MSESEGDYRLLRKVTSPRLAALDDDELYHVIGGAFDEVDPDDIEALLEVSEENFAETTQLLGMAVPKAISGAATGALRGAALGPLGALAGAAVGLAGGAKAGGANSPTTSPLSATRSVPGSPSAIALASLLGNPKVLQALLSMGLGPAGNSQVKVGGRGVPVTAIANLLGALARQSAAEFAASSTDTGPDAPDYLIDSRGDFRCDPMVEEERAAVLLDLFASEFA